MILILPEILLGEISLSVLFKILHAKCSPMNTLNYLRVIK